MKETRLLIRRILSGDRDVFQVVIQEHQRLVSHIVFRMVYNQSDRQDLCQDIFIKVYRNLSGFNSECKLSTWIAKIAFNTCIDFLKKDGVRSSNNISLERTSPLDLAEADTPVDELTERKDTFFKLKREIEKMPPGFRTILTLYHLEEMSYAEISEITQLPVGTVKSYLFRARRLLREKLEFKYQKEDLWH